MFAGSERIQNLSEDCPQFKTMHVKQPSLWSDLSEQSQLSKAGALANTCQLILIIIIDGEAALLHHIKYIPCTPPLSGLLMISPAYKADLRAASNGVRAAAV